MTQEYQLKKYEVQTHSHENWVKITKEHYDELADKAEKLDRLEAAGVDNWEGYDEAVS